MVHIPSWEFEVHRVALTIHHLHVWRHVGSVFVLYVSCVTTLVSGVGFFLFVLIFGYGLGVIACGGDTLVPVFLFLCFLLLTSCVFIAGPPGVSAWLAHGHTVFIGVVAAVLWTDGGGMWHGGGGTASVSFACEDTPLGTRSHNVRVVAASCASPVMCQRFTTLGSSTSSSRCSGASHRTCSLVFSLATFVWTCLRLLYCFCERRSHTSACVPRPPCRPVPGVAAHVEGMGTFAAP